MRWSILRVLWLAFGSGCCLAGCTVNSVAPNQIATWHPKLATDVLDLIADDGTAYWVMYQHDRDIDAIRRELERIAAGAECRVADFDCDGDVDLADFGLFQGAFDNGKP